MSVEQEIEMFQHTCERMLKTFAGKRNDYGQTTEETFKKFGPVSLLIRMHDKLGRLDNLMMNSKDTYYESIDDTLIDLANYAIIALIELTKARNGRLEENVDLRVR